MLLLALLAIGLGGLVTLAGIGILATSPGAEPGAAWLCLKRMLIAVIPSFLGIVVLLVGLLSDPLWPDQDETPERRAARLAASAFAGRAYLGSAVLALGGILAGVAALYRSRRRSG